MICTAVPPKLFVANSGSSALENIDTERRVAVMSAWLRLRIFLAFYVLILGIGFMFSRADVGYLLFGALLVTVGLTILLPLFVVLFLTLRENKTNHQSARTCTSVRRNLEG